MKEISLADVKKNLLTVIEFLIIDVSFGLFKTKKL